MDRQNRGYEGDELDGLFAPRTPDSEEQNKNWMRRMRHHLPSIRLLQVDVLEVSLNPDTSFPMLNGFRIKMGRLPGCHLFADKDIGLCCRVAKLSFQAAPFEY